jgi:hypothetical protein
MLGRRELAVMENVHDWNTHASHASRPQLTVCGAKGGVASDKRTVQFVDVCLLVIWFTDGKICDEQSLSA